MIWNAAELFGGVALESIGFLSGKQIH